MQQAWDLVYLPYSLKNSTYCSWTIKLDPKDPKHLFEGNALIHCLVRIGVLDESRMRLDYVPDSMETEDFLELQLQTQVFKSDLVQSIHHAHVLIRKRHIRVGKQIVNDTLLCCSTWFPKTYWLCPYYTSPYYILSKTRHTARELLN